MKPIVIIVVASVVLGLAQLILRSRPQVIQDPANWPKPGQPPTMADVERLAKAGQKITAIKFYREIHNVGLKEAKDAVEKMTG
jgi:ribosomal protein L7/L12